MQKPRRWPLSFIALSFLGAVAGLAGLAALAGLIQGVHPLFNDSLAAGLALIVTAIALILSGLFPLVLRRLAARED